MDLKLLNLCNEILGYLYRMLENEHELRVFDTDFYFRFCVKDVENIETYEQAEVDQALNELVRRGFVERKNNFYRSLYPGKLIEITEEKS